MNTVIEMCLVLNHASKEKKFRCRPPSKKIEMR